MFLKNEGADIGRVDTCWYCLSVQSTFR